MTVKVKDCTVELVFSIWNNEIEATEVEHIITEAIEKAGYSLSSGPNIVMVREREEDI